MVEQVLDGEGGFLAVYGLLADVHGNLEALRAALEAIDARGVGRLVCLGDIVGYNADSNACVEIVRRRAIESVAGNHDLISIERLGFDRCANKAAYALERTRRTLSPESRRFLATLEPWRLYEGRFLAVHGGVEDVQQYVRNARQIQENAGTLRRSFPDVEICFYGHTHDPKIFEAGAVQSRAVSEARCVEDEVREIPAAPETALAPGRLYFINPGSVDASRKREHKLAEFGIFDSERMSMEFHRVPYDHGSVEEKALRGGYRIGKVTDLLYSFRRRLASRRG